MQMNEPTEKYFVHLEIAFRCQFQIYLSLFWGLDYDSILFLNWEKMHVGCINYLVIFLVCTLLFRGKMGLGIDGLTNSKIHIILPIF